MKRRMAMVSALAICMTLTACGGNGVSSGNTSEPAGSSVETDSIIAEETEQENVLYVEDVLALFSDPIELTTENVMDYIEIEELMEETDTDAFGDETFMARNTYLKFKDGYFTPYNEDVGANIILRVSYLDYMVQYRTGTEDLDPRSEDLDNNENVVSPFTNVGEVKNRDLYVTNYIPSNIIAESTSGTLYTGEYSGPAITARAISDFSVGKVKGSVVYCDVDALKKLIPENITDLSELMITDKEGNEYSFFWSGTDVNLDSYNLYTLYNGLLEYR